MSNLSLVQNTLPQDLIIMQALLEKTKQELDQAKTHLKKCLQVAHDIRSPLPVLKLISEHSKGLENDEKELLDMSVNRVEEIAEDLLKEDISILENTETLPLELKMEPILKCIRPIISEKKASCSDKRIAIDLIIQTSPLNLKAYINVNSFQNSMANLIQNSIEAMNESKAGVIEVILRDDQENIYIDIIDNGKGIKNTDLSMIKKVGGTKGKSNGNGLGLSGSIAVMKSFGGSLDITSTENTGTSITLTLPKSPSFTEGFSL